jgi:hypothetical protein
MLFAIIDYLAYRTGRGHYSAEHAEEHGYKLATDENFAGSREAPPGCFFVLSRRASFASWVVMYGTNSIASHAGLYVGSGQVVDALTTGVKKHSLDDYLDGKSYLIDSRRMHLSDQQRQQIVAGAHQMIGTPYNWRLIIYMAVRSLLGGPPWESANFRLYSDALLLISLPILTTRRSRKLRTIEKWLCCSYVGIVGISRLRAWASKRVRDRGLLREPGIGDVDRRSSLQTEIWR